MENAARVRNRTITVKVAEVLSGGSKQEFYAELRELLDLSRRAANLVMTACLRSDEAFATKGDIPVKINAYAAVNKLLGKGQSRVAASISRQVEKKYFQDRNSAADGRKSIANFRSFPLPLLCNSSTKNIRISVEGQNVVAEIKLKKWWKIRFAGGSNQRFKLGGIKNAIAMSNNPISSKTVARGKNKGQQKIVYGGFTDSKIWMQKNVAIIGVGVRMPAASKNDGFEGVLKVRTSIDNLLVASRSYAETPWVITGDKALKKISERDRKYRRLSQDRKSGTERKKIRELQAKISDGWQSWINSFVHEISSHVVQYAKRRKVEKIELDCTVQSFMPRFPYFMLSERLAYKCEDAGIGFENVTKPIKEPDVNTPHIYFKFSPATGHIKIGKSGKEDGSRHSASPTDSPDPNMVVLAIQSVDASDIAEIEKQYKDDFLTYKIKSKVRTKGVQQEWFEGEPILKFLRERGWLGNTGNVSQLMQVLPLELFTEDAGSSSPSVSMPFEIAFTECSQDADKRRGYAGSNRPALAVT